MAVTVTKDMVADVLRRVKELTKSEVLIGIPEINAERQVEEGDEGPITNSAIGYIMEFGSPAKNIPARPFLIPGVEKMLPAGIARLKTAGEKALGGKKSDIEKELTRVGILGQNAVRGTISDGPFVPLAQSTIEARARRGRKGAQKYLAEQARIASLDHLGWTGTPADLSLVKPLIDTGQLRASVSFVVRQKGK